MWNKAEFILQLFKRYVTSMFIEIFHQAFCFLMRSHVTVVVVTRIICHNLDAFLDQPVQALLQRRVHRRDCCRKAFRIKRKTVTAISQSFASRNSLDFWMFLSIVDSIIKFENLFIFPSVRLPYYRSRFGFYGAKIVCRKSLFRRFFLRKYSCSNKEDFPKKFIPKREDQARLT